MTAVSSAPAQPAPPAWVLWGSSQLWQHFSPKVLLEHPSEAEPLNRGTVCTHKHTQTFINNSHLGGEEVGQEDPIPIQALSPLGRFGEKVELSIPIISSVCCSRPVSSAWHCWEQHKRPSVWKVQERKGTACGLVLQSKDWHRGWEVLRQRLIPSPLKLTGKLPWTPASSGSCLKFTKGNKAASK